MVKRALIIDDEAHLRKVLSIMLGQAGWQVAQAAGGEEGLRLALAPAEGALDVVLCDMRMPGLDGLAVLERLKAASPELPVVIMTAFASVDTAVAAMKAGAADYVSKPFNEEQILLVLDKALERRRIIDENRRLKRELSERYDFSQIVTASPALGRVLDVVRKVADTKTTVLIQGESGTGKELLARAVHHNSPRHEKPFVAVNCGAVPAALMESEFFGHVKGAFTGADRAKEGLFAAADGGTLFLDEVGELGAELQVKLLRVLQDEEIRPVGSVRAQKVDVRLLAATNQDLERLIAERRFREDLYYRLAVIRLRLPPLRERPEDVPLLANHFLNLLAERHKRARGRLSEAALARLARLPWRGNVRELMNVVEQAFLLADGPVIGTDHLPSAPAEVGPAAIPAPPLDGGGGLKSAVGALAGQTERRLIAQALEENGGNRTRAAAALGISRRALQMKIKAHGL